MLGISRRFGGDRRGNVAITFALALLPMTGIVGVGIDYSRALATKTALDAAADAAALAAVTEASSLVQQLAGQVGVSDLAVTYGVQAGQAVFKTDSARVAAQFTGVVTPAIQVTPNGRTISATVTYAASQKNAFGALMGVPVSKVAGAATASLKLPSFMAISVAIDVSQSMGLAATAADMTKLKSLTPDQCAFGCHVVAGAQLQPAYYATPYFTTPYETLAHQNNVTLRIDVIQAAVKNMISTAQAIGNNKIAFNLYTMQYGLTPLSATPTNYSALLLAANGIDLGANNSGGTGDSNFAAAMPTLSALVPTNGDGSSFASAQQFVFIMTDGVQDVAGPCTDGHCTQAFDPSTCAALKNKNVTVGVIYTTYLAMPEEQTYRDLVQPFAANIPINLRSCASPGWYYEASDATAIQAAINNLFNQATNRGLLTQ